MFVARLSTTGSWLSAVRAGGPGSEQLSALAVDATGTTYTCGSFSGEHALFGATNLVNATATGSPDGFVAQLSPATRLTTTVPVGATAGPIRVRTSAGTSISATFLVTSALASVAAEPALGLQLWPNPVTATAPWQVRLPAGLALSGPTQVDVYNGVGQLVAHARFSGSLFTWAPTLPAGLYQLLVRPAHQPAWHQRLIAQD